MSFLDVRLAHIYTKYAPKFVAKVHFIFDKTIPFEQAKTQLPMWKRILF